MKKYLVGFIFVLMILSPIYAATGFAITYGETTYGNSNWKNSMDTYFQTKTTKNVSDAATKLLLHLKLTQFPQISQGKPIQPARSIRVPWWI